MAFRQLRQLAYVGLLAGLGAGVLSGCSKPGACWDNTVITCVEVPQDKCLPPKVYQGDETTCETNPIPTGACWDTAASTCVEVPKAKCIPATAYQGDKTTCATNPVPSPTPLPLSDIWGSIPLEDRLPVYMKSYGNKMGAYTGGDSELEAELANVGVLAERLMKPFVDAAGNSHNPYEADGFAYVTSMYSDGRFTVAITGITNVPASTPSPTPSLTPTPTPTATPTVTPTVTPTPSPFPSPEASPTDSPTPTPTETPTPTATPTPSPSPSSTPSPSPTPSSTPPPEHLTIYAIAYRANAQEGLDCPVRGTLYFAKVPSSPGFSLVSLGGMVHSEVWGDKPFGGKSYKSNPDLMSDAQLMAGIAMRGVEEYYTKDLNAAQCRLVNQDLVNLGVREGDLYFPQEDVELRLPEGFLPGSGSLEDVFTPSTRGLDAHGGFP
ncbi:MAG: hypothetical protein AABX70_03875 [Nanoarchaeota archaeon]